MKLDSTCCRIFAIAGIVLSAAAAAAADYPDRPVRMIVPAAPGGGADYVARVVSIKLSESLGQTVVIDNRTGASGTIAAEITARSAPDGYTLLMAQSDQRRNRASPLQETQLQHAHGFRTGHAGRNGANILVAHPGVPANTVKELIALAKAKSGQMNFPSSGSGAPSHLAGEMFKNMAGVDLTHVPYKGAGPAANALLAGEMHLFE